MPLLAFESSAHQNPASMAVAASKRCTIDLIALALILLLLTLPASTLAQNQSGPDSVPITDADAGDAVLVTVGTYVQNITDLSLRDDRVAVDFYLWFRWQGHDDLAPHESFELINGDIDSRVVQDIHDVDLPGIGPVHFSQARVRAHLHVPWALDRFSLDRQSIPIRIEDSVETTDGLRYLPDTVNSAVRPGIRIPGYKLTGDHALVSKNIYATNFGDPALPNDARSVYSQYEHRIEISRPGYAYFLKLFTTMFLSTLVVALAFLIHPESVEARVGLGVGALFSVVAANYVIAGQLPETGLITLADRINLISVATILVQLVLALASTRLHARADVMEGTSPAVRWLDGFGLLVMPLLYTAAIGWLVLG